MPRSKSPIPVKPVPPKTSVSPKQLAANRANAARSTGPRTPEGKARSARNALKHGFNGSTFAVVRVEELQEVARLKADAVACYRPVNSQEMFAVERIALAQHLIFRGARLEAGLFTSALDEVLDHTSGRPFRPMSFEMIDGDIPVTRAQNRNYAMGEGFRRLARESNVWSLLFRYQAQAERQYRRAVEDFERLKALRSELPNEPIWQDQPEEKQELADLEELNVNIPLSYEPYSYNPRPEGPDAAPPSPVASLPENLPLVSS